VGTQSFSLRLAVSIGVAALLTGACGSSPSAPSPSQATSVAGTWDGTTLLPNAYSTTLTLQQSGGSVSGRMRIAGVMGESPITGTVASGGRTLTWRVNYNCEVWTGDLALDGGGLRLEGLLFVDRRGCVPARSSGSGNLTLEKR